MRAAAIIPLCTLILGAASTLPAAADGIRYLSCRADNEDAQSVVAIDEARKKVCDPEFARTWMAPSAFDTGRIAWGDGASTKSITHSRKGSRYEHDTYFIVVHIGHCNKIKAPAVPLCSG